MRYMISYCLKTKPHDRNEIVIEYTKEINELVDITTGVPKIIAEMTGMKIDTFKVISFKFLKNFNITLKYTYYDKNRNKVTRSKTILSEVEVPQSDIDIYQLAIAEKIKQEVGPLHKIKFHY